MKYKISLLFSLFLITGLLQGQDKFNFVNSNIKKDLNINPGRPDFQIDTNFNLLPDLDLSNKIDCHRIDLFKNSIFQNNLRNNSPLAYKAADEFPGSSVYYAKRPSLLEATYEKDFIIKPDTNAIYYLIINGHPGNRIIK